MENVFLKIVKLPEFHNCYQTRIVRDFPKPDAILIDRAKNSDKVIAFEFKPPHCDKREYITGIGQSLSYYDAYPFSYLIIPDVTIDSINIPEFIIRIIEKSNIPLGLIKYDITNYEIDILKNSSPNFNLNEELRNDIIEKSSPWSFWMDTSIEEVAQILHLINNLKNELKTDKNFIMTTIWENILSKRYKTTSNSTINSFKLNYQLFFDHLNLWTKNFNLTNLGYRLKEISISYGYTSNEFIDALSYLLLTDGNYLLLYRYIHEFQSLCTFGNKGNESKLLEEIRDLRISNGYDKNSYEIDNELVDKFEKNGDEWLRVLACEFYKKGYGKGLTQILSDISHKIPYMNSMLKTDFLMSNYIKNKGFPINWMRISNLLQRGKENLNVI